MKGVKIMGKVTPENWKLRVLRTDRNEVRVHISTALVSVFYKDREGLEVAYQFAKRNLTKEVAISIMNEYRKLRMQGV